MALTGTAGSCAGSDVICREELQLKDKPKKSDTKIFIGVEIECQDLSKIVKSGRISSVVIIVL
jgi:hypothetical protein